MCARTLSQVRRTRAVIEEKRAGAGRITIQLRGERERANLFLHHTQQQKFPLMLATRATTVRARASVHAHTLPPISTQTRSLFFILVRRKRRRREQNRKAGVQPLMSFTSLRSSAKECFLQSFQSIQSIKFFPQIQIPKFRACVYAEKEGEKEEKRGGGGLKNN